MLQYHALIQQILSDGIEKQDRTGVGTKSIFGAHLKFNLNEGFPLLTTRKLHFRSIVHELLWFIQGSSNIAYLKENGVSIWDEWADENGELGPIYGVQWRKWLTADAKYIDQLQQVIDSLKTNPDSRRHIVSAWNVGQISAMKLPPCHVIYQFYVANGHLSCLMYQRSADVFLGLPFNIASYALLTHLVAQVTKLKVNQLHIMLGDTHLYLNHLQQAHLLLSRFPYPLPTIEINPAINHIDHFKFEDIILKNYIAHPKITAPIAV